LHAIQAVRRQACIQKHYKLDLNHPNKYRPALNCMQYPDGCIQLGACFKRWMHRSDN